MSNKCEGPEWESLVDSIGDLLLNDSEGVFDSDDAYMNEVHRLIAEAGFDLEVALAQLKLKDEEAWADFVSRTVPIKG